MNRTCSGSNPRDLAMRIRILSFALEREVDRALAEKDDITLAQFMLLMPVAYTPGITQRAIATMRNLTEAAVSRQAEALRKKGYLERERNPQMKRERILQLTPAGRAVMERAMGHVDARLATLFAKLTDDRRKEAVAVLDDIITSVGIECPSLKKANLSAESAVSAA